MPESKACTEPALAGAFAEFLQDGDGAVAGAVVAPVEHPVVMGLPQQAVQQRPQPGGAVVGREQDRDRGARSDRCDRSLLMRSRVPPP